MAATLKDPRTFFTQGSVNQYEFVLGLYEEAIKLKAQQKNKKFEDLLKLDKWYQIELPKKIKSRGKDAHLTHEELVKCMKWKLFRGKFSPRFKDLIQMNTPRLCMSETKKAFRALFKKDDLTSAIQALCNLKGVGPAMASVILTAAKPECCGFMADECLLAIPEIESIDYTTKELLNFVDQLKLAANRLNKEGGNGYWSCHKVEQALWAYFIVSELNKDLLRDMPEPIWPVTENGTSASSPADDAAEKKNGDSTISSTDRDDAVESSGDSLDSCPSTSVPEENDEESRGEEITTSAAVAPPSTNGSSGLAGGGGVEDTPLTPDDDDSSSTPAPPSDAPFSEPPSETPSEIDEDSRPPVEVDAVSQEQESAADQEEETTLHEPLSKKIRLEEQE